MKKHILLAATIASISAANAQEWLLAGNPAITPGTDFLGTTQNDPLDIRTEDIHRFRLLPDATYTINTSFTNQVKDGSLLLCPDVDQFYANGAPGPYSLLHLAAATNNAQQAGYRSNMGNGITLTGNNDQMYVGQLFNGLDFTDAAIVWSDNPGEWLADRLTFNFTSGYNSGASAGNTSFRGLQTMLIQPDGNGQEAYVGVGDFDAVSATPEERIDVLDGKVRIRQLPTDAVSTSNEYVTVNTTTGVLEHRPLPPSATPGCEWYSEPLPAFREVRSGLGNVGTGSCPDRGWLYTIGQQGTLTSKFNIYFNGNERTGITSGLNVNLVTRTGVTSEHYGINVNVSPESGQSAANAYGVKALVQNPGVQNSFGTYGRVTKTNNSSMTNVHGAYGHVELSGGAYGSNAYGTYGWSRLVGCNYTNVFGGYSVATIDGSSTVGSSYGLDASSSVVSGSSATNSYGVRATSSASSGGSISSISYGVKASGSDGGYQSFGIMAEAGGTQGTKFGVYGKASGGGTNYSV